MSSNTPGTEVPRDVFVNEMMIGGGVLTHQVHRRPVFLSILGIEIEPSQIAEFLGQILVFLAGEPAVMIADLRASTPAATVAQQAEIRSRFEAELLVLNGEFAELNKMVAAATGAELRCGLVAIIAASPG